MKNQNNMSYLGSKPGGESGGGDVSGPVSSTDKAIVRWNGNDGKTIQDSPIIVQDNGKIITGNGFIFDDTQGSGQILIGNASNGAYVSMGIPVSPGSGPANELNLTANVKIGPNNMVVSPVPANLTVDGNVSVPTGNITMGVGNLDMGDGAILFNTADVGTKMYVARTGVTPQDNIQFDVAAAVALHIDNNGIYASPANATEAPFYVNIGAMADASGQPFGNQGTGIKIASNDTEGVRIVVGFNSFMQFYGSGIDVTADIVSHGNVDAVSFSAGGTPAVADGTYTVGIGLTTNGTITVKGGIITAVQEAS